MSASEPKRQAILLVDHGSRRDEANRVLAEVAELLRRIAPEYHVEIAHLELAEPTIAQAFEACVAAGAREIIVHPYMLAPGRHAAADIPKLARAAAKQHPEIAWRVTAPLGVDAALAEIVLRRVREPSEGEADGERGAGPA